MSTMPPCVRSRPSRRRSTSATIGSGASSIIPVVVRSISGTRGCSAPRSTPWGESSSIAKSELDAVGARAEAVAVGAAAQHHVEDPLGPAAGLERLHQLGGVAPGDRRSAARALALHHRVGHEVIKRLDLGVAALAGGDPHQPEQR